jgi:hypothetical protein
VSLLPTATGLGYTLVSASGEITAFGDATAPSLPSVPAGDTFVAADASPLGGLWMASAEGRVVAAGAPALADLSRNSTASPVIDMAATATGQGYYLLLENGKVRAFGDARRPKRTRTASLLPDARRSDVARIGIEEAH